MKIVSFVDKKGSAIHRLSVMIQERLPHIDYEIVDFHPKRPSLEQIQNATNAIKGADLIHWHYWKTAMTVKKTFPAVNSIPCVLTHTNEHNINDTEKNHWEWKDDEWGHHVCVNGWQKRQLEKQGYDPTLIKLSAEFDNLEFTNKLIDEKVVLYVGQIKKVKGVRELKQACDELDYRLHVIGGVSEAGYWDELNKDGLLLGQNISDDKIYENAFSRARVYCANSDDGTESGTMPILEAMVSGIPVVTRKIGHVRDMGEHKKNMWIRDGKYTDIEDLKSALKIVMENDDIAHKLRENAWRTVRQYHPDVMAREYEKVFRKVLYGDEPTVSIIIPTFNRVDILLKNLGFIEGQSYKNIEIVVCDDGSTDLTERSITAIQKYSQFPIRYVNTRDTENYGLAKARNLGVIESIGDILVFCDDRLKMHNEAITSFVNQLKDNSGKKVWLWGSKGKFKSFVENFSATWRKSFINGGMFNERMDEYGGMTQEISNRFSAQKFKFDFCPQSLAEPLLGTHSKSKNRRAIINSKIKLYKMGMQ